MNDKECVNRLLEIENFFIRGSKDLTGEALEAQQKYISALRYVITSLTSEVSNDE